MRRMRVVACSVAGAALLLVAPTSVASADSPSRVSVVGSTAGSRDLPRRDLNDEVFKNDAGSLIFRGDVEPGWNNKSIRILKRLCQGCDWKLVRWISTDGSGRWRIRIYAPRSGYWYWKAVVPKSGDYGWSASRVYRTYVV